MGRSEVLPPGSLKFSMLKPIQYLLGPNWEEIWPRGPKPSFVVKHFMLVHVAYKKIPLPQLAVGTSNFKIFFQMLTVIDFFLGLSYLNYRIPYILANMSRNFGQNLTNIFSIGLIAGAKKYCSKNKTN